MNNTKGFSLVELMVAVGIVGVMSSVAVPKYQKYKVNATRAEAQSSLSSMYTLQQLYYTENDSYGKVAVTYAANGKPTPGDITDPAKNVVGFPFNADQKYKYAAVASGTDNTEFKGTAESKQVLGSCAKTNSGTLIIDKWCINHNKKLANKPGDAEAPCVNTATGDAVDGGC